MSVEERQYTGIVFGFEDVILDAARFQKCRFVDSRLIFTGGPLPRFDECVIGERTVFVLDGCALRTMKFLSLLLHSSGRGGAETVERVLDELRRGAFQD